MITREEARKRYDELVVLDKFKPSKATLHAPEPSTGKRTKPKPTLDQLDSFKD